MDIIDYIDKLIFHTKNSEEINKLINYKLEILRPLESNNENILFKAKGIATTNSTERKNHKKYDKYDKYDKDDKYEKYYEKFKLLDKSILESIRSRKNYTTVSNKVNKIRESKRIENEKKREKINRKIKKLYKTKKK